jgi:hypothetical protein
MSSNEQFDNHVKEQLGNYTPDVPPHIWDNIVARRKKKKPGAFWLSFFSNRKLLVALAFLLAGSGTAYWLLSPSSNKPLQNTATKKTINNTSSTPGNNNIATAATNTIPNSSAAAGQTGSQPALAGNTPAAADNNDNPPQATPGDGHTKNPGGNPAGDTKSKGSNYSPLQFTPSASNLFIKRKQQYHLPIRLPAATAAAPTEAAQDNDNSPASEKAGKTAMTGGGTTLGSMLFAAEKNRAGKADARTLNSRQFPSLFMPDCPSVEDNAAGNKRYFDVYAGPDLGLRSFSGFTGDSNSINYLNKRKETAKFTSAFSAGLRYTRVFNNGMSLRTGVNYSQINEKFKYINEKDIRYILVITPRDVIINGTPTTVYDTLRYTETGTRIRTTYNRYRTVDIPLQLGYEFGNGRLHTNISAGAIINVYSWQKGDVLDSANQPVSITTGKGSAAYGFKTNIGVGFLGSVSVYYKLNGRLHLMAEPYIRYNLKPMSRDNQSFTQKYNTVGLRLGVRWDLR